MTLRTISVLGCDLIEACCPCLRGQGSASQVLSEVLETRDRHRSCKDGNHRDAYRLLGWSGDGAERDQPVAAAAWSADFAGAATIAVRKRG